MRERLRGKNPALLIGTAGAVGLLLAAIFFTTAASGKPGESRSSSIPSLAPASSDTFVIAPHSGQWWNRVAAMTAPETGLAGLDPAQTELAIENIGYSRSPDMVDRQIPFTGALRLFYVESPTAKQAAAVASWLKSADGFDGRTVSRHGEVVVVGQSWVQDYQAPTQTMNSVEEYDPDLTSKSGTMWKNFDQEVESLAGQVGGQAEQTYETVLRKGLGLTGGTTWTGFSKDGAVWAGEFVAGGVDEQLIDFSAASKKLHGTEEELAVSKNEKGVAKMRVYAPGMSAVLSAASFSAAVEPQDLGASVPTNFPKVNDPLVSVVNDVTEWNYAVTGTYSGEENLATRAISANEDEMTLSYTFSGTR